jgi:rhodanese-related sulfurtransferase/DNA-binding transcriptional ArsR family regulator
MPTINVKKELLEQLALLGKALGSANRLELLEFLAQGERSVESLARLSGMSIANTSQHLRQLRQAGLVATRKEGLFVFNRLADEAVVDLMTCMREIAENNLSRVDLLIRTYLLAKDSLEPISAHELLQRVHDQGVTVLDVRPIEEFMSGHLPGAVNIPLHELEQRLAELPNHLEVVAYCRGPYCMLSFDAVAKLRDRGYQARRLEDGYPEWKRAGLPVESLSAEATRVSLD